MPTDPEAMQQSQEAYARRYQEAIEKARRKLLHPDEKDDEEETSEDREIPAAHHLIPVETQPEELRPQNPLRGIQPPEPREESMPLWKLVSLDENPSIRAAQIQEWRNEQAFEAGIKEARKKLGLRR